MTRLAEEIAFSIGDRTVRLLPSLRGALRIAREFGGFAPVIQGIREGSITLLTRIIREGQVSDGEPLPDPLFEAGDRGLYFGITALQVPALSLVLGWMGVDPDAETKPADANENPIDAVEEYERMFGFATGILKWSPAEAWAATPREIMAAYHYRQKALTPADDKQKPKPAQNRPLDQQAMLFAARLETRAR